MRRISWHGKTRYVCRDSGSRARICVIMIINRNYRVSTWFHRRCVHSFFFLFLHSARTGRPDAGFGLWVVKSSTGGRRTHEGIEKGIAEKSFCDLVERMTLPLTLPSHGPNWIEFTHLSYREFRFTRSIYRKINKKKKISESWPSSDWGASRQAAAREQWNIKRE